MKLHTYDPDVNVVRHIIAVRVRKRSRFTYTFHGVEVKFVLKVLKLHAIVN